MRVVTVALAIWLVAAMAWAASTPVEVMKGAKSIHVIAPSAALDAITDMIVLELPQVSIEGSRESADVIVRFIVTSSTATTSAKQDQPPTGDRTGYTGKIGKQEHELSGDAIGTVSGKDPKSTAVMFMGAATEEGVKSFARDLIKAWKEANPEAEAPKK